MLKGTQEGTGVEIMDACNKDQKLKKFTHLLENSDVYPILRDSKG